MTQLCIGQLPDIFDTGHDGNRLALALCRLCPGCPPNDPTPHGVIRQGVAYSGCGTPLPVCDGCGYPIHDYAGGFPVCSRCAVPDVPIPDPKAIRNRRIRLLVADGLTDEQIGDALGIQAAGAKRARLRAGANRRTRLHPTSRTGAPT